jgi:hypothetical protein
MPGTAWNWIRWNSRSRREQSGAGDGKPSPVLFLGGKTLKVSGGREHAGYVARDERGRFLQRPQFAVPVGECYGVFAS